MLKKTPSKTNLYINNPTIAKEWHPAKNGSFAPRDITAYSNRKVWWLCPNDHAWQATVTERIHGKSCPYCSGAKVDDENIHQALNPLQEEESHSAKSESPVQAGMEARSKNKVSPENCLQTVNPNLAKEWHPAKNKSLTPKDVAASSRDHVWWLCSKGHEWKAAIYSRNNGDGCFYCSYMQRRKHM